jgi:glyoxylase-like metal-dependent hydrolase (beta-lactamase superfamily II)
LRSLREFLGRRRPEGALSDDLKAVRYRQAGASLFLLACVATLHAQTVVRTGDIAVRGLTASDFPRMTKLAENVYGYEQLDPTKRGLTANNLVVVTTGGVLVAEGQGTVDNVRRLVSDIATITPQPIKYVVIGSEHGDHTGGDSAFPDGVTFIAHPFSKANLERQAAGRRPEQPKTVIPTETVDSRRVINLGATEIQILFLGRAHTGGDLEVYLPRENILFMSEVFINRIFPSMANGYPTEWIATLRKAEGMGASIYVPAHGFIDSPQVLHEEMLNYRSAIERVIAEGKRLHDSGVPADAASAAANFGPYSDWTRVGDNAANALKRVYMELDGQLK